MSAEDVRPEKTEVSTRVDTMRGFLLKPDIKAQFAAALPKVGIDADRFVRLALTTFNKTPELYDCDPKSVLSCLILAAQSGLSPSSIGGDCYLVPFKNKKTNRLEAQFIPGYRGLMKVARRSGIVATFDADIVRKGDRFSFKKGIHPVLEHEVPIEGDRGPMIGVWALATLKDGSSQFVVMRADEVMAVKSKSKASQFGPWADTVSEPEMWKKTALRRLCKFLPLEDEDARVVLDAAEREEAGLLMGEEYGQEEPPEPGQTVETKVTGRGRGKRTASPARQPDPDPVDADFNLDDLEAGDGDAPVPVGVETRSGAQVGPTKPMEVTGPASAGVSRPAVPKNATAEPETEPAGGYDFDQAFG